MPIQRLYVARDDNTTIVSLRRLRVTGPGMVVTRWGGIEESVSASQTILPAPSLKQAAAVLLPPGLTATAFWAAGAGSEATIGAGTAVLFVGAYLWPLLQRKLRPADARPRNTGDAPFRTLFDEQERRLFQETLDVAERITDTWPDLEGLIDQRDAEWSLNQALWDLADLLARRQQVRRILASLESQKTEHLRPDSTASAGLAANLTRARTTLQRLENEAAARRASLADAQAAGTRFVHEQRTLKALQESSESLTALPVESTRADIGAELAERTAAVLQAYQELSEGSRTDTDS